MMKKQPSGRLLTEKDMEGSEYKLSSMSEFDKLVEVCRVAAELYDDQEKQDNATSFDICPSVPERVYDKSWGKRIVSTTHDDQESDKAPVFSSRTCRISGEELFKWGRKKSMGESSSSSRCYEFGNVSRSPGDRDRDQRMEEKVVGKKRKYYGYEDFEYCEKKEKVLGKKRTYCRSKDEDFEYSEKKEKKARKNYRARNRVVETAPLPVEFANEIQRQGGDDVRLLIQKNITNTDVSPGQNRFSIPNNQVREEARDFLTEAENKTLARRYANKSIVAMQVPLLEPNLNRSHISFKKWPANKSFWYVLCGSWSVMQINNHLEAGTDLQVWSFRVNGELNLALVNVPQNILQI